MGSAVIHDLILSIAHDMNEQDTFSDVLHISAKVDMPFLDSDDSFAN